MGKSFEGRPSALRRFLRGPPRDSPQLDGSPSSFLCLCRDILWILLLTVPEVLRSVWRIFSSTRGERLRGKVVVILHNEIQDGFFDEDEAMENGARRIWDDFKLQVTGSGNGLGREMSMQLAREGCKIACVDIDEESNKQTVLAIVKETGNEETAKAYKCDVSKLSQVEKLAGDIIRDFGRVDILINNAGILYGHKVTSGNEAVIRRVIDVNLLSSFWMVRAFLPEMQKRKCGHIVFINSGSGINPIQHSSAYCTSKYGLLGFAHCVDEELRRYPEYDDIKVSTACPYFIATNPEYVKCWKLRMPPISVSFAASEIITGVKRGYFLFHVPSIRIGYFLASVIKLMPYEVYRMYKNVFYVDVAIDEKST